MKKRLLAQVLALCMVLSLLPVSVFADVVPEQLDVALETGNLYNRIEAGEGFNVVVTATWPNLTLTAITARRPFADPIILVENEEINLVGPEDGEKTAAIQIPAGKLTARGSYTISVFSGGREFAPAGDLFVAPGAAEKVIICTPHDLVLREDGRVAAVTSTGSLLDPRAYLADAYYNETTSANLVLRAVPEGSGWGFSGDSVTEQAAKTIPVVFDKLYPVSTNGEAVQNAQIQFTAEGCTPGSYWAGDGTFNIPGAKLTPPAGSVRAGSAVTLNVTEARDADFAPISGSKSVSVTDVTGGAKRQLVANAGVAFTNGEAAIELPESAFTETALGERTLDVTIGGIYQTLHATVTVETAQSKLSIDGLLKPGEEGAAPAAVTGADAAKTYDGAKTVPAALYKDWTVSFKDENNEPVDLKKGTDYRITSVEFAGKDAGAQTVTAVVQLLNNADTKDYSLTGGGRITISGASITRKEITVKTAKAENKAYDGSTKAAVSVTFDGLVAGESLSADDYTVTAAFDSANVGRAKPVDYSVALETDGTAKNYTLKAAGAEGNSLLPEVKAAVTAATLTPSVSFGIDNKGAAEGTLSTEIAEGTKLTAEAAVTGAVASEIPVLAYAWTVNGKAVDADAGTPSVYTVKEGDRNITVTVTLAAVDGATNAVNGNYVMASAAKTASVGSVMIDAASLTLPEGGKITKAYDGTIRAALPSGAKVVFAGLPEDAGVKYIVKSVEYTSADAGTHSVTVTVELSGGNGKYVLNNGTFTFTDAAGVDITKADVPAPAKSLRVAVDDTQTITLKTDGAVSASIDDETKAAVSVKDSVITVKGVATGSAELTISAAAGGNYNALADTEVAVTVTAKGTGSSGGSGSGGSSWGGNSSGGNSSDSSSTTTDSTIYSGYTGGSVTVRSTAYVSNGSAVVSVSSSDAQNMVREAAQNSSSNVTVVAEVPAGQSADTVRAELPASAVSDLYNRTNASLTVETPVASVVIPNASLYQLSGGSGSVAVVAARNSANTVSIAVQRNGYNVSSLSSGMKVEIPVASVAPNSGVVAVLVNPNGSETVLPKSVVDGYDLTVLLDSGSATIRYRNNAKSFSDVSGTYWANDAIDFVSSHNLFIGTTNTTFGGYTTMNRAMLVTVLHRLESTPSAGSYSFADVPYNSYYAQAASWASSRGIVQGDGSGFSGSRAVTREEMAVMLYRYVKTINGNRGEMGSYSNMPGASQVSGWASEAMRWAVGSGIIQGDNTGNLRPQSSATRAEVAQMLMNFVELITR